MIGFAQELAVTLEEITFPESREIAFDPGLAQQGPGSLGLAAVQQRLGEAHPAPDGQRPAAGKPVDDRGGGDGVGQRLLGVALQDVRVRPIGILLHEGGDIGEAGPGAELGVIDPGDEFGEHLIVGARRQGIGGLPTGRLDGGEDLGLIALGRRAGGDRRYMGSLGRKGAKIKRRGEGEGGQPMLLHALLPAGEGKRSVFSSRRVST